MWTRDTRIEPTPIGRHLAYRNSQDSRDQGVVEVFLTSESSAAVIERLKREIAELRQRLGEQRAIIEDLERRPSLNCTICGGFIRPTTGDETGKHDAMCDRCAYEESLPGRDDCK